MSYPPRLTSIRGTNREIAFGTNVFRSEPAYRPDRQSNVSHGKAENTARSRRMYESQDKVSISSFLTAQCQRACAVNRTAAAFGIPFPNHSRFEARSAPFAGRCKTYDVPKKALLTV
jgi:hypothetical protein